MIFFSLFPVLQSMLGRRGGDLSGGQQQQFAIGRALVTRPKILVLDEPTEGIQPSIIKDIGRAIKYLRDSTGMAILLVEQYLDFCRELADHVYIMDRPRQGLARPSRPIAIRTARQKPDRPYCCISATATGRSRFRPISPKRWPCFEPQTQDACKMLRVNLATRITVSGSAYVCQIRIRGSGNRPIVPSSLRGVTPVVPRGVHEHDRMRSRVLFRLDRIPITWRCMVPSRRSAIRFRPPISRVWMNASIVSRSTTTARSLPAPW
jgi:energy-coupling factor transporter ATP-binding protein EcfA2